VTQSGGKAMVPAASSGGGCYTVARAVGMTNQHRLLNRRRAGKLTGQGDVAISHVVKTQAFCASNLAKAGIALPTGYTVIPTRRH
jgi:hypothetical protein